MPTAVVDLKDREASFSDGSVTPLGRLWQNSTLVLVFLRHYGWPFCREQVAQLRRRKEAFEALGARVVLVGLGTVAETAAFKSRFDVPFDMIADPDKTLFEAFGLAQASTGSLLSPGMALKGLAAMARGHGLGIPKGDVRQLPGVFIIAPDGSLIFGHAARGPADHPDPDVLIEALREAKRPVDDLHQSR